MSESLAEGLVSRFVGEWTDRENEHFRRTRQPTKRKRAAAYREMCKWVVDSIAPPLRILKVAEGKQDGSEKSAHLMFLFLDVSRARQRLLVKLEIVRVKDPYPERGVLLDISRHALVRLFQRLKTQDHDAVLAELRTGVRVYWAHAELHKLLLRRPEILVPSEHGAFAIGADEDDAEEQLDVIVKTWISDARMSEEGPRLRAVQTARSEGGFVLMVNGRFVVVSSARLRHASTIQAFAECIREQMLGSDAGRLASSLQ